MNPLLPLQYYTPDVEARVFQDEKIYLYGSNDIPNSGRYCSYEYHVFSSDDMEHWQVHEKAFEKNDWWGDDGIRLPLFAPDCEYINGKYCMFYCTKAHREGVAFSDTPTGKFVDAYPIKTADGTGIDPSVLVEGDKVYYFWGQQKLRGAQLNATLDDIIPETFTMPLLTREKDGFREGASVRKIGDWYYMVFADGSRFGDAYGPTCLSYALSKNPLGPYEKKGVIIDNMGCDPNSWNNHGSLQQFGGQWYVFYHRATNNGYFSRRVCVEPVQINSDGTIDEVEMTTQGASGAIHPTFPFGAQHFCRLGGEAYITSYTDATQHYEYLTNVYHADYGVIKYIDFSQQQVSKFTAEIASNSYPGKIVVTLDAVDGTVIAELDTVPTKGDFDFQVFSVTMKENVQGIHAIYVNFQSEYRSAILNLKSFRFA